MSIEKNILQALRQLYSAEGFDFLYGRLDTLHDFAMEGQLHEITDLTPAEVISWLSELAFIARETIREIEAQTNELGPPDLNDSGRYPAIHIPVRFE